MPPPTASHAPVQLPPKLASTTARMHQAAASSTAPAVSARVPSEVPAMPRSWMMRASIGKAVMAMAAPRKSEASSSLALAEKRPGTSCSQGTSRKASAKGTAMPATDTDTALRARLLK